MKWVYRVIAAVALLACGLVAVAYGSALRAERPVGFQVVRATGSNGKPFAVGVWYPSETRGWPTAQIGTVLMEVAQGAAVAGRGLPLVVLSHGNGGGLQSHADLALALAGAGYVVAATMHAGDNFLDQSAGGAATLYGDRNRELRETVDYMLGTWPGRGLLDPERVGAFGFSAGGFTVLTAIGAQPDLRLIATHCAQAPEFVCDVLRHARSPLLDADARTGDPMQVSARIRAAVVAAPGLGFTMSPARLAAVQVPVQLWIGEKDDKVPYATNAKRVEEGLAARAEVHAVPGAGHASFLAPCGVIRPAEVCSDPAGFDRASAHRSMNDQVLKFFDRHLNR